MKALKKYWALFGLGPIVRIGALVLAGLGAGTPALGADEEIVELVYFGSNDDVALLGVGQGLEDATRGLGLEGFRFNLRVVGNDHFKPFVDPVPSAILAAVDAESLRILAELNPELPIFNLADENDRLRDLCVPNLLHILPSARMRADAVGAWRSTHPEDRDTSVEVRAWDGDMAEPPGSLLNERFLAKRGMVMSEQAWTGWAAANLLVAAIAETNETRPALLVPHIRGFVRVDGLKGSMVSFRDDGQLRQTLFVETAGGRVVRVPEHPAPGDDALDAFGRNTCAGGR